MLVLLLNNWESADVILLTVSVRKILLNNSSKTSCAVVISKCLASACLTLYQFVSNSLWQNSIYWHLNFIVWFKLCSWDFACCIFKHLPSICIWVFAPKAQQFQVGIDYCCFCFVHHVRIIVFEFWSMIFFFSFNMKNIWK